MIAKDHPPYSKTHFLISALIRCECGPSAAGFHKPLFPANHQTGKETGLLVVLEGDHEPAEKPAWVPYCPVLQLCAWADIPSLLMGQSHILYMFSDCPSGSCLFCPEQGEWVVCIHVDMTWFTALEWKVSVQSFASVVPSPHDYSPNPIYSRACCLIRGL